MKEINIQVKMNDGTKIILNFKEARELFHKLKEIYESPYAVPIYSHYPNHLDPKYSTNDWYSTTSE